MSEYQPGALPFGLQTTGSLSNCALIPANSASLSTPLRCSSLASRRLASVVAIASDVCLGRFDELAAVWPASITSGSCPCAVEGAAALAAARGGAGCGTGVVHACILRRMPPTTVVTPHRKQKSRKRKTIKPPPFMSTPSDALLAPTAPSPPATPAPAPHATPPAARCARAAANTAPRAATGSCG